MSSNRTSIELQWDQQGRIRHSISGLPLLPPRDDQVLWILAPSAPFLLAHQLGTMSPAHALIVSSSILDMIFRGNYVLSPINSTLKGARIDFIYKPSESLGITFSPRHPLIHNSDSLEEGVRQLLVNYFHYIYSPLPELNKIAIKTITITAVGLYLDFLNDIVAASSPGRRPLKWDFRFSVFSAQTVAWLSQNYYVPDPSDPSNQGWAEKQ